MTNAKIDELISYLEAMNLDAIADFINDDELKEKILNVGLKVKFQEIYKPMLNNLMTQIKNEGYGYLYSKLPRDGAIRLFMTASVGEIKKIIKDESLMLSIMARLDLISSTHDVGFIRECINDESLDFTVEEKIRLIMSTRDVDFVRECINDENSPFNINMKFSLISSTHDVGFIRECIKDKSLDFTVEEKIQLIISTGNIDFVRECIKDESLIYDEIDLLDLIIDFGNKDFIKECIESTSFNSDIKFKLIKALAPENILDFINSGEVVIDSYTKTICMLLSFDENYIKDNIHFSKLKNFNLPKEMTIGIEIESEGFLSEDIREYFDFNGWEAKEDGSLEDGVEITSPILHPSDENAKQIYILNYVLNRLGQEVSENCGGHIHIGSDYLTSVQAYKNLEEIYCNTEKILYAISNEKYSAPRGGIVNNAKPLASKVREALNKGTVNLTDETSLDEFILGLQSIQVEENLAEIRSQEKKIRRLYNGRYSGVNLVNINNGKNTIEFRLPNGTLNPDLWMYNINLFGEIVAVSEEIAKIQENGAKNDEERKK